MIEFFFIVGCFLSFLRGYAQGWVVTLFLLLGMVVAAAVATFFAAMVIPHPTQQSQNTTAVWLPFAFFIVLLVGIILLLRFAGIVLQKRTQHLRITWLEKLLGILVHLLVYSFIFSSVLFFIIPLQWIRPITVQDSFIYPFIAPLAPKCLYIIGQCLPFVNQAVQQLEQFFTQVATTIVH